MRVRVRILQPTESVRISTHMVLRTPLNSLACSFLLAFACVVLVAIVVQGAPAAPGDPKPVAPPQELWNAFPLNPKAARLDSYGGSKAPFTPPAKPQAVAETPPETSRSDLSVLALAGGAGALIFLALLGFAAMRLDRVAGRRRRSAPLWQGTAGIEASPIARRLQHYADVDVAVTRPSRLVARDVERRSGVRRRPRRPQAPRDLRVIAHRMRRAVWNEDTSPFIVGSVIAIVAAFVIIYLVS